MATNSNNHGRTFYDFMSEHRTLTNLIVLLAFALLAFIVNRYTSIKAGPFEMSKEESKIKKDTVLKIERETIYVKAEKAPRNYNLQKSIPTQVKVTKGDTVIEVKNQPANINTGTNNGIIGNDNSVFFSNGGIQRKLTEKDQIGLKEDVNKFLEKEKLDKTCFINVLAIGDNEAQVYAKEILNSLKKQGFNVAKNIGSYQRNPPIEGVAVEFKEVNSIKLMHILVGYPPSDD